MAKTTVETGLKELEGWDLQRLHRSAAKIVDTERRHVAWLIAHLAEISRRKAYLELGYPGLFAYCTRYLGLSEGSAGLRMQVANVCRRFPILLESLAASRISVTVAGMLARHLTEDNVHDLLERCEGKTKEETKTILSAVAPKSPVSSGIRQKPASEAAAPASVPASAPDPRSAPTQASAPASGSAPASTSTPPASDAPSSANSSVEPARPELYNFRFSADQSFREKLERLAEVIGVTNPARNLAEVLEKALDVALDRKDPRRREERRRQRAEAAGRSRLDEISEDAAPPSSRSIPAAMRGFVLERAGYRCEYEGPGGVRCDERTGIEVDHIVPYARGGTHHPTNLRALCRAHNRWCAEREFGAEFIRAKIRAARSA